MPCRVAVTVSVLYPKMVMRIFVPTIRWGSSNRPLASVIVCHLPCATVVTTAPAKGSPERLSMTTDATFCAHVRVAHIIHNSSVEYILMLVLTSNN